MMRKFVRKIISPVILSAAWTVVAGQITYTAAFTRMLEEADILYAEPAEQWLHVILPPDHAYMDYDLVLENDRGDFEVRYRFHRIKNADEIPPSVEIARLVASIATNDPETEIRIRIPSDDFLQEAFNADMGIFAHFTPKEDFSEKPFGTLISLYPAQRPGLDIIVLYRDPAYDPISLFRSIRFRDK